jgi:hypothetical protein
MNTDICITGEACIVYGRIYAFLPYNIKEQMWLKTQLDWKPAARMEPVVQKHSIYALICRICGSIYAIVSMSYSSIYVSKNTVGSVKLTAYTQHNIQKHGKYAMLTFMQEPNNTVIEPSSHFLVSDQQATRTI